jgi:hypothetical protein
VWRPLLARLYHIYVWEIDHFVIKSDILGGFFNFKTILKIIVLPWQYFMFGKHNGFVNKARIYACMYFLAKQL